MGDSLTGNIRPYFSQGLLAFYKISTTDSLIFCNDTSRVCWTEKRKKGTGLNVKYSERACDYQTLLLIYPIYRMEIMSIK